MGSLTWSEAYRVIFAISSWSLAPGFTRRMYVKALALADNSATRVESLADPWMIPPPSPADKNTSGRPTAWASWSAMPVCGTKKNGQKTNWLITCTARETGGDSLWECGPKVPAERGHISFESTFASAHGQWEGTGGKRVTRPDFKQGCLGYFSSTTNKITKPHRGQRSPALSTPGMTPTRSQ